MKVDYLEKYHVTVVILLQLRAEYPRTIQVSNIKSYRNSFTSKPLEDCAGKLKSFLSTKNFCSDKSKEILFSEKSLDKRLSENSLDNLQCVNVSVMYLPTNNPIVVCRIRMISLYESY